MNVKLLRLERAAAKYAYGHGLTIPIEYMPLGKRAAAISNAVEHAADHPKNKYAPTLLAADRAFARSRQ